LARCRASYTPRDPEKRGGTVSIDMPQSYDVCRELLKRDILVDYRPKAGVRMSPHFYTDDRELDTAIAAVEEILRELVVVRLDQGFFQSITAVV